jgi:hypothetical protein
MERVARAFPILPGAKGEVIRFLHELLNERRSETNDFYRKYGVIRETAFLQDTPMGSMLIVVTDVAPEDAFERYGASQEAFDTWFKERVRKVSGIDMNEHPRGPRVQRVFDWKREDTMLPQIAGR